MIVLKRRLNKVHYPQTTNTVTESYQHCVHVPLIPGASPVTNPNTGPSTNDPVAPSPGICYIIDVGDSLATGVGGVYLGNGRYKVCVQSAPGFEWEGFGGF